MSNNYCLKASGKQIVELARLMDVHSRRTGFDEPMPITRNLSNGNLEKRTKTNEKEY